MARIRSIHPGIFTDEAFASASMAARMLLIGIWTEAYDDGVFEWKPLTLKMKIFPGDSVDINAVLSELEGLGFFRRYEFNGRQYAAVRNFQRYQRPKKPNSSGALPNSLLLYVGRSVTGSEQVQDQFGNGVEIGAQMEDGGGSKEEEIAAAVLAAREECERVTGYAGLGGFDRIAAMIADGVSLEGRILPIIRACADKRRAAGKPPPDGWWFFEKAIRDEGRQPAAAQALPDPVEWIDVEAEPDRFAAANRALVARTNAGKTAMHVNSRQGRGAFFPKWAADEARAVSTEGEAA